MSFSITTPIFKPSSMAEISCLFLHSPSIFTSKTPYPFLSIPSKPIKFQQLSYSNSTHFSLQSKKLSSIVSFVSQNPDSNLTVEEEGVWENEEFDDTGAPISKEESGDDDDDVVAFEEPSEDAKIYVGNLPYDLDHQGLAELFDQSGTVEIAEVIMNRDTNQSRGFGFVTMSTVEEAEKAVEKFNGQIINGRSLTVNKAGPRGSRSERPPRSSGPSIRIYVGNLPWDVDSSRLEQMFSEHGKVVEARVVSDRETGRSRGFGFVTMSSETETNEAIAALDGESLNGRAIRVNVAEERPRRNFF